MRSLRLVVVLLAVLVAAPAVADAQVWKPKSRLKSPGAKTRKTSTTKTPVVKKKKAKIVAKKKKKAKKRAKPRPSDDDFTIIEEDYPDDE